MSNLMTWIDDRFPATKMWNDHLAKYYTPKNFNFWYFLLVLLWFTCTYGAGDSDRFRYLPDHALQTGRRNGVCFCRAHHA